MDAKPVEAPKPMLRTNAATSCPEFNLEPGKKYVCKCGGKLKLKRRSATHLVAECNRCGRELAEAKHA